MIRPPSLVLGLVVGLTVGFASAAVYRATWGDSSWTLEGTPVSASSIGVEVDGWSYAIPTDVPWVDVHGSHHDSGRPSCLPDVGWAVPPVRFHAVEVAQEGSTWRQVVWVQCLTS